MMKIDINISHIDKSVEADKIREKYYKEYGDNPEQGNAMAQMWGFEDAEHFYAVRGREMEEETLAEVKSSNVKVQYLKTLKSGWLVAFSWMSATQGAGYGLHPSESIAFKTKDDAKQCICLAALQSFQGVLDRKDSVTSNSEKQIARKIQEILKEHLQGQLSLF